MSSSLPALPRVPASWQDCPNRPVVSDDTRKMVDLHEKRGLDNPCLSYYRGLFLSRKNYPLPINLISFRSSLQTTRQFHVIFISLKLLNTSSKVLMSLS